MPIKVEAAQILITACSVQHPGMSVFTKPQRSWRQWRGARLEPARLCPGLMQSLQLARSPGPGWMPGQRGKGLLRATPPALGMTSLSGAYLCCPPKGHVTLRLRLPSPEQDDGRTEGWAEKARRDQAGSPRGSARKQSVVSGSPQQHARHALDRTVDRKEPLLESGRELTGDPARPL